MTANAGDYGVAEELRDSLRSNIDMGNITAFTTRPIIITEDDEITGDTSGALASGVLILNNEIEGVSNFVTYQYEHEPFLIDAIFYIAGGSHKTSVVEYLEEIKRVMRSLNESNSRAYEYRVRAEIERYNNDPLVNLEFTLIREYVKKYT